MLTLSVTPKHTGSARAGTEFTGIRASEAGKSGFKWRWPHAKHTAELSGLILEAISDEKGGMPSLQGCSC